MRRILLAAGVWLLVQGGPGVGMAGAAEEPYPEQMGWGLAAVGANLLYMPAKVVYAAVGGITGSLAYVLTLGQCEVAQAVWSPSLGGTYVLSPEMVRGDRPVYFSGESYEAGSESPKTKKR